MNNSRFIAISCAVAALLLAACSSDPSKDLPPENPFRDDPHRNAREMRAEASTLYRAARKALDSGDYTNALTHYDQIAARYPFTDYATQADLERIYAQYRSYDPDKAIFSADKFLREHPRHPAVDYVQYLKGLINSDRETGLAGFLGLDTTKEDVSDSRRAFDDFALLVQKYPDSRYAADARQRMIFLRNRLAQHDMHVVRFYMKRGAYIAAAKRAEQVITQYPGAPVAREALQVMEKSYRELGLTQQADDAAKLLSVNPEKSAAADAPAAPTATVPAPPQASAFTGNGVMVASSDDDTTPWYTLTIHTKKDGDDARKDEAAPAQPADAQPATASAASATSTASTQGATAPATEKRGGGISVTMEPYEEWPVKKPADKK